MEQAVHRAADLTACTGCDAVPGFHQEVGGRGPGEPGQVLHANQRSAEGFDGQLPQPGGQPRGLGEGQRRQRVDGRDPAHRGQSLQVGRQGRIDRRFESEPGRVHGLLVVQAMRPCDQPGDQEVLPRQGRDPVRHRPSHALVVVGVGRAFIPGQLQAGQRVAGQILLREIARVIQIDHGQRTAEAAQQITPVIAAARPHDHLRPHISAGLRQRQHHRGDDEPGLIRAGCLIQGIDDHVEPAAMPPLQDGSDRRGQVIRLTGQRGRSRPGNLPSDLQRGLALGVHRARYRPHPRPHRAIPRRQRDGDPPIGGGDDPAQHRRLAHPRRSGHHQHPPIRHIPIQPGHDRGQRGSAATEPPAPFTVDAHPTGPGPPMPHPLRIPVQRPAPLGQRTLSGRRH